jgi:ribosomal-protein-alanine N-acetyltransferase
MRYHRDHPTFESWLTSMNDFNVFPALQTERLVLRQMKIDDAIELHRFYSDNQVVKHLDWNGPSSVKEAEELILSWNQSFGGKQLLPWGIALKANNVLIGTIMLMPLRGTFEMKPLSPITIGFELSKTYWNNGIMSEALKAVTDFGTTEVGAHRIQAEVAPANEASLVILQRSGFKKEGLLQKYLMHQVSQIFIDVILLALISN